jgi:hypothetical protein
MKDGNNSTEYKNFVVDKDKITQNGKSETEECNVRKV